MAIKVCIVSTVCNPGKEILALFIDYHLSIGFEHIILFFENLSDEALPKAREYTNVTVLLGDRELKQKQMKNKTFNIMFAPGIKHPIPRQVLNQETAINIASEMGFDWMLHLDQDELFYPENCSVKEHFEKFSDTNTGDIIYYNHEAVPEKMEIENFFKEVTLFKLNGFFLKRLNIEPAFYKKYFPQRMYFNSYGNGKSAVRVAKGALPSGVHTFHPSPLFPETVFSLDCSILHYFCTGFSNYWEKFKYISKLKEIWFDPLPENKFYFEARDAAIKNDIGLALDIYEKQVMLKEPEIVSELLKLGIIKYINYPKEALGKIP